MTFYFFIYLQGLNFTFLNLYDKLYEKLCRLKKKDDDYTVNKIPCLFAATCEFPFLLP
jgi:hypothetical protein